MVFHIHLIRVQILAQKVIMFLVLTVIILDLMTAIVEILVIGATNQSHIFLMNVNVLFHVMEVEEIYQALQAQQDQ